jgi:acylphosphatase
MPTIKENYLNALLADATYALNKNTGLTVGTALSDLLQARMTPTLATQIAANFSLVTHIETDDVSGSGFDGTVWRRTDGKLYVSMQGTEGLADFLSDIASGIYVNGYSLNRYNTLDATAGIVTNRSASSVQTLYSDAATNTTLTVQNNGSQTDSIAIRRWSNAKSLGLSLDGSVMASNDEVFACAA